MCHDIRSEHSSRGEVRRWIAVAPTNSRLVLTFLTQSAHTQQTQPQVRNITAMTGIISILSRHLPRSVQNAGLKAVRNHEVSPPHGGVIHIDRYASTCILVDKRDTQRCSLKGWQRRQHCSGNYYVFGAFVRCLSSSSHRDYVIEKCLLCSTYRKHAWP